MKKNLLIIPVLFLMSFGNSFGQNTESKAIGTCLKTGNATQLSTHFISSIDLTLIDEDDVFSKSQAEAMLLDFFKKNKPNNLKIEHEGTSKSQDHFAIGTLSTNTGNYRVTYFLKKTDDTFKIKQLRIENLH